MVEQRTVAGIVQAVREIAAEQPDFKYTDGDEVGSCAYGAPANRVGNDLTQGCIIGRAFDRAGFEYHEIIELEIIECLGYMGLDSSTNPSDEARWLYRVQFQQDTGETWGDAVAYADRQEGWLRR